jgi:hypothetical protein
LNVGALVVSLGISHTRAFDGARVFDFAKRRTHIVPHLGYKP